MANNRLYIKCNVCGETLFIGKSFGGGFYYHNYGDDPRSLAEKLNDFYDRHAYCSVGDTWGDEGSFSLEYEEPPRISGITTVTIKAGEV